MRESTALMGLGVFTVGCFSLMLVAVGISVVDEMHGGVPVPFFLVGIALMLLMLLGVSIGACAVRAGYWMRRGGR